MRSPHSQLDPVAETREALSVSQRGQGKLHLVTQRSQPYGSKRRCCERCGVACGPYWPGGAGTQPHDWTSDEEEWKKSGRRCS